MRIGGEPSSTDARPVAERQPQGRRSRNRYAILDATARLFLAHGPDAVTTEDIALEAGLSARTFFNHFENRSDLVAELAHERALVLAMAIEASAAESCTALFRDVGAQMADYASAAGTHYHAFIALLTRHNATGDAVRSGSIGSALHSFAARIVATHQGTADLAPVAADLLAGALIVTTSNFAVDPEFDLAGHLVAAGEAIDSMLGTGAI